ncbi:MAG: hypothetical protein N3A55_00645 [Methylohalobius sp.]|nr:hypothetical protein [Methylohalobius sp.]
MERFIQIHDRGEVICVELKGAKALNHLKEQLRTQFKRLLTESNKPVVIDLSDAWWLADLPMPEIDAFFYQCTKIGRPCKVQRLRDQ